MNYAMGQGRNGTRSVGLSEIYRPVDVHLVAVNELLQEQIASTSGAIAERLAASGLSTGKRIRPAMLLIAGGCFSDVKKTHIAAAAALELVHVATLVHDDVLDRADERRHEPSLNALCDNTSAILTGDYLFSKAFEVACGTGSMEAVRQIAQSSCAVCEGEIKQNLAIRDFRLTRERYFEIISMKTARLCRVACGLGGVLSECDSETILGLQQFGENIGLAFQIIDDVLDIVGSESQVGKTLGTDLLNGKMTLPMIHCLEQQCTDHERASILAKLERGLDHSEAMSYLSQHDSIGHARETARGHANEALKFCGELPPSPFANSLCQLAEFVLHRTF